MNEMTGTAPTPESKCPTCGKVNCSITDHYDFSFVESKPTSEGARTFAEKWLGERYVEKYPGQVVHEVSVQMAVDLAEAYAAPFRSQLAAAEKEREKAQKQLACEQQEDCYKQPCGHCISLEVRSVESPGVFCELCEMRSERNDALQMEKHLSRLLKQIAEASDQPFTELDDHLPEWIRTKIAAMNKRAEAAESEIQRLRERIAELEGSK